MLRNISRSVAAIVLLTAVLAAFRVEGQSYFLGQGETAYFLTMSRCQREAGSTFLEGGPRYAGYRCVRKFLWFTLDAQEFYSGKPTVRVG